MKEKTLIGSGIVAVIASFYYCTVTLLSLIEGGTRALAGTFTPLFIGFILLILGYAWYHKFKTTERLLFNSKNQLYGN